MSCLERFACFLTIGVKKLYCFMQVTNNAAKTISLNHYSRIPSSRRLKHDKVRFFVKHLDWNSS